MSTLARVLIGQALREHNIVAVGDEPTAAELADSLPVLNTLLTNLFGFEIGEQLSIARVPVTNGPAANSHVFVHAADAQTIVFPVDMRDGAQMAYTRLGGSALVSLDAGGWLIEGSASLLDDPTGPPGDHVSGRRWFFRADLGNWIRVQALGLDDPSPLPPEWDDLLTCGLAIRVAPRFSVQPDPTVADRFMDQRAKLRARYRQEVDKPAAPEIRRVVPDTRRLGTFLP